MPSDFCSRGIKQSWPFHFVMLAEQISDAVITACKDKTSHLRGPFHFLPVTSRSDLLISCFFWVLLKKKRVRTTVKTNRFQQIILITCNIIIITSLLCECSVTIHMIILLFFIFIFWYRCCFTCLYVQTFSSVRRWLLRLSDFFNTLQNVKLYKHLPHRNILFELHLACFIFVHYLALSEPLATFS